jgi:hypothetical protein
MNAATPEKQSMAKPAENLHVNKNKNWNRRVALVGLGLLVILPVSFATFDFRSATAPSQPQMASTRSGWYLSSGQWRADVRTLAAAFEYVMDWMPGTPSGPTSTTNQLASLATPIIPDALVLTQANAGPLHHPAS